MQTIGIKFKELIDYEVYEPLQYWLDYDFEYEDLEAYIQEDKVIELELEEDEDREEDIEMLKVFLAKLTQKEIAYELFGMRSSWEHLKMQELI